MNDPKICLNTVLSNVIVTVSIDEEIKNDMHLKTKTVFCFPPRLTWQMDSKHLRMGSLGIRNMTMMTTATTSQMVMKLVV